MKLPNPTRHTILLAAFALACALALAMGSVGIQRYGPERGVFGNLCGPTGDDFCYGPLLNGGFPLGFVYDFPGISIENKLGAEDRFRIWPFLADVAVYWALLAAAWTFGRARRKHMREMMPRRRR